MISPLQQPRHRFLGRGLVVDLARVIDFNERLIYSYVGLWDLTFSHTFVIIDLRAYLTARTKIGPKTSGEMVTMKVDNKFKRLRRKTSW